MTNLELKHAASELAFATAKNTALEFDSALAAKVGELQLTDAQYTGFKQSVTNFRAQYQQAANQDAQILRVAGATHGTGAASVAAEMLAEGDDLSTVRKITQTPNGIAIVTRT